MTLALLASFQTLSSAVVCEDKEASHAVSQERSGRGPAAAAPKGLVARRKTARGSVVFQCYVMRLMTQSIDSTQYQQQTVKVSHFV
jgi:hypothetical protein